MNPRIHARLLAISGPRNLLALTVMLVVTSVAAVLVGSQDRSPDDPADIAFIDAAATSELVASTTDLVDRVFSVDPRHPKATTKLIEKHLTAKAQQEFRELYAPYLSEKAARITLQTSTTSVAVVRLDGRSADVLVVADQQASAPDGRTNAGTAAIRLSLTGGPGSWHIAAIDPV